MGWARFRWPAVGLMTVAAVGLAWRDPAGSWGPMALGGVLGLLLSFGALGVQAARARRALLRAEALWQGGGPAAEVAELLGPYRSLGGELGHSVGCLLARAHLALGWRQSAWSDLLEAQVTRAPWWRRRAILGALSDLPASPEPAALQRLRRLAEAHPEVPRLWHGLGLLHLRREEPGPAWEAFRKALTLAAEDPLLLEDCFLASLEFEAQRDLTEGALALLRQRHGDPRIPWDRGAAGRHLLNQGRHPEVVALLRPLPPEARTTPWHWAALAIALRALGETTEALAELEEGLRRHPESFRLWMERYRCALEDRQDLVAEASLGAARAHLPEAPTSLAWELDLALADFAYWVKGDLEGAREALDRVPLHVQADQHPPLRLHLRVALGEFEAAHRELQPLLARHPEDLDLALLQAEVLAGLEAWKALLPYLDQLPADARGRAGFWHLRGLALVHLGDPYHSRMDLERAAHMEPGTLRYVLDAGHGCAELGEWERSETHWRQALRLEPTDEEALIQLAEARRYLHDLPGARQLLRECLTHHPGSQDAQARLAELEAN